MLEQKQTFFGVISVRYKRYRKNVVISKLIVFVERPGGLSDQFKLAKHRIRFSREFISFILLKPRDRHLVSLKTQSPSLPKLIFQPVLKFELDYRAFSKVSLRNRKTLLNNRLEVAYTHERAYM